MLAATKFGVVSSPNIIREMMYIIRQSWSGCMEENQPGCAATGGGGLGSNVTTLIEVEQLRVAARLSISTVLAVLHLLEITRQHQKVQMFLWRSQNEW